MLRSKTSAGKYQLDVTEIRSAMLHSDSLARRVQLFRDDRIARIVANEVPVSLRLAPKVVLHLVPASAFDRPNLLNPASLGERVRDLRPVSSSGWGSRLNLDGLLISDQGGRPNSLGYVQVYRSGILEVVDTGLIPLDRPLIPSLSFEQDLLRATARYIGQVKELGLDPPLTLMLTIIGAKGKGMGVGDRYRRPFDDARPNLIDRDVLLLPDVSTEDLSQRADRLMKPVLDMLWQATGWPESHYYDAEGNWVGERNS